MEIKIRGNVEITKGIKTKIEEQLNKLNKYSIVNQTPDVVATVLVKIHSKEEQKVVVTIPINKRLVLKAEAKNNDLYTAVDMVYEKIEGQIRKEKTQRDRTKNNSVCQNVQDFMKEDEDVEEKDVYIPSKEVVLKPMDVDEAIQQMEVLEHDFFIFKDSERENICLVYKKKKGGYGLIETKES